MFEDSSNIWVLSFYFHFTEGTEMLKKKDSKQVHLLLSEQK